MERVGRSHRVPLSPQALAILQALPRVEGMPGDFWPYDLRRSADSHMTTIGISRFIVSNVLNHAEHGVTAVYDRHSYGAEKRTALNTWGARLAIV